MSTDVHITIKTSQAPLYAREKTEAFIAPATRLIQLRGLNAGAGQARPSN
jgi:hypothetical protein